MLNPIQNAGLFLVNTFFDFVLLLFMVRFLLCWARSDYFNPITRFIVNVTQRLVVPIRIVLRTHWNIEFASLFIIFAVAIAKYCLLGFITVGGIQNPFGLLLLASGEFIKLLLTTLFYAIFLFVIVSLIQQSFSPLGRLLQQLTTPILRPFQRIIPTVSGFDLSPIPAIISLQLLIILVANPLLAMGTSITFA